ncbi:GtrA family protein [Trinickia fusca]|uniref:GtrA family protein n=1 Tax=Trinickia fusca TaxID=2419777 RepID=UPI00160370E4|nr:GtrA family protein [Trinickia fusca]
MKLADHSSVRYLLVGVSNTAIGFAVIWIALSGLGFGNVAANVTGYAIAFLWSFALNRKWTFRHRGAIGKGLLRYALVCLVAYLANLAIVVWLSEFLGQRSLLVQVGGMITYTVLAYVGSRCFAFPAPAASAAAVASDRYT